MISTAGIREYHLGAELKAESIARRERFGLGVKPAFVRLQAVAEQVEPKPAPAPIIVVVPPVVDEFNRFSVKRIIAVVARAHRISANEITGKGRSDPVVHARCHAIALIRQHRAEMSLPAIGRRIGRDHSTVLYSIRKWPKMKEAFAEQIAEVEAAL